VDERPNRASDPSIDGAVLDTNALLALRLKQILETPGISDKDRKLVERNLRRLLEARLPTKT
jgi:hypothetical protein